MQTQITIRPAARGGKYLGHDAADSSGTSALIMLQEADSGLYLDFALADASNPQSAGPNNLMDPVSRAQPFATAADTVQVQLTADINVPTRLYVHIWGPFKHMDQARWTRSEITLLPGVNIGGSAAFPEGLVLEINGLCISNGSAVLEGPVVSCSAMVTMMCGCPIRQGSTNPGWPWPDSDFAIALVTHMESGATYTYRLSFDTTPGVLSSFKGSWPTQASGGDSVVKAWIYALEQKLGNQGSYPLLPSTAQAVALPPQLEAMAPLPPELRAALLQRGVTLASAQ